MKKFLCSILALLCLLSMAACGESKKETTPAAQVKLSGYGYESPDGYSEVKNKLSWDAINAIPLKREDMTEKELRQVCVDMHRLSREFVWISNAELRYLALTEYDFLKDGTVYAGFPYTKQGTGNVYRVMDYMDPETGVVDIATVGEQPGLFGNMCSCSAWWGWARVVNSVEYMYSKHATAANGCLPVGSYVCDETRETYDSTYGTGTIIQNNGEEVMFESYAQVKMADGLVCNQPGSHVVMASANAQVVRDSDGKINPDKSSVTIIDQTAKRVDGANQAGDAFSTTGNVDKTWTFTYLVEHGYIPFTFAEFKGTDPVEKTEVSFSHQGDTITKEQLFASKVTCNYALSDVYVIVTDSKGNEVYRHAIRAAWPCMLELEIILEGKQSFPRADEDKDCISIWGSWDNVKAGDTVQIVAQVGTGERPVLWEGKLAK